MSMIETRSIPELVENALRQASNLLSDEIALARAEISEKTATLGRGVTMVVVGAMFVIPALVLVLLAIAALMVERGMTPWLANLVTGAGALLIGAIVVMAGAGRISAKRLAPRETIGELRRDSAAVKEMAR